VAGRGLFPPFCFVADLWHACFPDVMPTSHYQCAQTSDNAVSGSFRITDDMRRMCSARTVLLRPLPSAVRRRDLPRRNLILKVIRIEAVEAAFARFRLRIHEKTDWSAVRPGQSDIVREVVRDPVHFPGPE
jgi:hypothetical protein